MTDTDSELMRRQQQMDVPQTIENDGRTRGPADLDDRDGRDRRQALGGGTAPGDTQQDAVFAQNTRGGRQAGAHAAAGARRAGGLVRRGRSLLGN
ncbi:hypothetical protein [Aureimonas leprariae]|uniref:Uncharacterized protein n=1 Tax=Plantimonas leprariae TaxID=2615207 RepID=A0A7V7PSU0_9HYPH|nr:hypothetical protein [Aureimonas leprariae]KAB0682670.1 hypothetical protein F6X38_00835 [Aureimonas leprariae]